MQTWNQAAYKVPAGVIDRCNLGYKVNTGLALDDIVVTKSLVPHLVLVDALAVHLHKGLLEADDAIAVQLNTRVVEAIADRDLDSGQSQCRFSGREGSGLQRHHSSLSRRPGRCSWQYRLSDGQAQKRTFLDGKPKPTLESAGVKGVGTVTGVAVILDLPGNGNARGLEVWQDLIAEVQRQRAEAEPTVI